MANIVGRHLIVDFHGCPDPFKAAGLKVLLTEAAQAAGATILGAQAHDFGGDGGATAFVMLAESHISAHTWPEHGLVAIDIFMCGGAEAEAALSYLRDALQPMREQVTVHMRGAI
jgi:S-adenosylmethionine decarboxylase